MQSAATTVEQYITELPAERQHAINELRKVIKKNLPKGFVEEMNYGMIGYVIPHSIYPKGYHCNPTLPLPFLSIASQKNFVAVYHMGIYADPALLNWFTDAYASTVPHKLDMGKSCIRFKKVDQIPVALFGELAKKLTVQQWIDLYEKSFLKK
jgi:uncharacterized protein YdhG (YjbR/CyaY superfamily)